MGRNAEHGTSDPDLDPREARRRGETDPARPESGPASDPVAGGQGARGAGATAGSAAQQAAVEQAMGRGNVRLRPRRGRPHPRRRGPLIAGGAGLALFVLFLVLWIVSA